MFVEELVKNVCETRIEKQKNRKDNEIWVSELVQCKQKSIYSRKLSCVCSINTHILQGIIIHKGVQEMLKELYDNIEIEKEVSLTVGDYVIKGRVDALIDSTVIEIKSAKAVDKPYEHHKLQLQLYMLMCRCDKGVLIYITPDRIVEFEYSLEIDSTKVAELLMNWTSPRFAWECRYCEFAGVCPYVR